MKCDYGGDQYAPGQGLPALAGGFCVVSLLWCIPHCEAKQRKVTTVHFSDGVEALAKVCVHCEVSLL